jgi:hypothetical protein
MTDKPGAAGSVTGGLWLITIRSRRHAREIQNADRTYPSVLDPGAGKDKSTNDLPGHLAFIHRFAERVDTRNSC